MDLVDYPTAGVIGRNRKRIDAPFLRAVTMRNLSVGPGKDAGREVSLRATTVVLDLNLRGWLFGKDARLLRRSERIV